MWIGAGAAGALASSTFYVRSAVIRTVESFGQIFDLYETMSKLLGSGTRVCQMIDVLEDMNASIDSVTGGSSQQGAVDPSKIVFDGVDIVTPLGQCLAQDLSISVEKDHSLMITGPNYVGKVIPKRHTFLSLQTFLETRFLMRIFFGCRHPSSARWLGCGLYPKGRSPRPPRRRVCSSCRSGRMPCWGR